MCSGQIKLWCNLSHTPLENLPTSRKTPLPHSEFHMSGTLQHHLAALCFDDGTPRWTFYVSKAVCAHCRKRSSAVKTKRALCARCRTSTFEVKSGPVHNPYVAAGGYRWCQRNCSTVMLPLDRFPSAGNKKCTRCWMQRRECTAAAASGRRPQHHRLDIRVPSSSFVPVSSTPQLPMGSAPVSPSAWLKGVDCGDLDVDFAEAISALG